MITHARHMLAPTPPPPTNNNDDDNNNKMFRSVNLKLEWWEQGVDGDIMASHAYLTGKHINLKQHAAQRSHGLWKDQLITQQWQLEAANVPAEYNTSILKPPCELIGNWSQRLVRMLKLQSLTCDLAAEQQHHIYKLWCRKNQSQTRVSPGKLLSGGGQYKYSRSIQTLTWAELFSHCAGSNIWLLNDTSRFSHTGSSHRLIYVPMPVSTGVSFILTLDKLCSCSVHTESL